MRIQVICKWCGSTSINKDAYASWNVDTQVWELDDVNEYESCGDCEDETSTEEINLDVQDPPVGAVKVVMVGDKSEIYGRDYCRSLETAAGERVYLNAVDGVSVEPGMLLTIVRLNQWQWEIEEK